MKGKSPFLGLPPVVVYPSLDTLLHALPPLTPSLSPSHSLGLIESVDFLHRHPITVQLQPTPVRLLDLLPLLCLLLKKIVSNDIVIVNINKL